MKSIDFRDATFASIQDQISGQLAAAWRAWCAYGPGTTREISTRSGISLLTFRPRTTDLLQLGMVEVCGSADGEGVYRAVSRETWEAWAAAKRGESVQHQMALI